MSAGWATRRRGVLASLRARPSSPRKADTRGVQTTPGATAFTRIPAGPSSTAAERTSAIRPALAAPYPAWRAGAGSPPPRPPPAPPPPPPPPPPAPPDGPHHADSEGEGARGRPAAGGRRGPPSPPVGGRPRRGAPPPRGGPRPAGPAPAGAPAVPPRRGR